jgi:GntR family transcriptional repressor for pyruvate dehydrogenase complex
MFEPITGADIPQAFANQIRSLLDRGELKPGMKIPSERELVKQLKVSRTSLREGLRQLETMGFIQIVPGKGTFIQQPGEQTVTLMDNLVRPWTSSNGVKELSDLFEVRLLLESKAAMLAAERVTPEAIETIQAALDIFASAVHSKSVKKMAAADIKFHRMIAVAAGNNILLVLLDSIARSLLEVREQDYSLTHGTPNVVEKHTRILKAIANRDPKAAAKEMEDHILSAYRLMTNYFDSGSPPDSAAQTVIEGGID